MTSPLTGWSTSVAAAVSAVAVQSAVVDCCCAVLGGEGGAGGASVISSRRLAGRAMSSDYNKLIIQAVHYHTNSSNLTPAVPLGVV